MNKSKNMAVKLFSLVLLGVASTFAVRAEKYDYTEDWNIIGSLAVGKSVKLVVPEAGEVYYKLSGMSVGNDYTFSAGGSSNAAVEVCYTYTYKDSYDTYIEYQALGYDDEAGVDLAVPQARAVIDEDAWEYDIIEDPSSDTGAKVKPTGYYLHVYGDVGDTLAIQASKGIVYPERSGWLTVETKGAPAATWSLKGSSAAYTNGQTIAIYGSQTVVFSKVGNDLTTPANQTVAATREGEEIKCVGVYNDKSDPKDDTAAGATKLTISAKAGSAPRTLYADDGADHFAFTAKDGVYYTFSLADRVGDAVMTLYKKGSEASPVTNGVTKIAALPLEKGDYILKVSHAESGIDATYTLAYTCANVGTISFAKTAVTAKKSAGTVTLTVNRSSGEGAVRVKYGTCCDTAEPGVDYIPQNGVLVWDNGDKKAKTISIALIPEAVVLEKYSKVFKVQLKPVDEVEEGEYQAAIASGKGEATVTLAETAGKASKGVTAATAKPADTGDLECGTYQGVIAAEAGVLTNGFPALASVTFTAKNALKKALSAKVLLGGKTYAFTADTWSAESDETNAVAVMTLVQKVDKVTSYTNELRVTVTRGSASEDWLGAVAGVELAMNVPDVKGKGYQTGVPYVGELYRDNAKVQDYLNALTNGVGYYTVALAPDASSGAPAGNGYLTLTVDNKGKAKVAGLLADGSTKPSYSSIVAIRDDGDGNKVLYVPIYVAKSPYCFGGTLKLVAGEDGKYVVDSSNALVWNNDNALLTYDGEEGWQAELEPVGGYFNTVDNLQAYYYLCDLSIATVDTTDLLEEALATGYAYVSEVGPHETPVTLTGNALSTEKRVLVKGDDKLVDFEQSVNPCNVQVKLTRATGIVTGSFSVWTQTEDGTKQKEMTNFKHNGILILSRGDNMALDDAVLTAGFFAQTATIEYEVTDAKGRTSTKTRKYTASNPFNILAVAQDEPADWYNIDWGEKKE